MLPGLQSHQPQVQNAGSGHEPTSECLPRIEREAPGSWSGALLPLPAVPQQWQPQAELQRSIPASNPAGGSGCPPNGASQGCDPFTHPTAGLGRVHSPWSCFSPGFGVIFSHSHSTRCHMAASELFGCLIGGVN